MIPKSFSTKRLMISEITAEYDKGIREIIGWLNNPLVVRFSEQRHVKHTVKSQHQYINSCNDYAGIYTESENGGHLIGTLSVFYDEPNRVANVGIMIGDHSKWGNGYGFEAWESVCNTLLENGCRKIEAGCMICNYSMMSICSRYGMMEEGRQEDHFLYHDVPMDLVHWGKIK